jgi:hypothetical protein
MMTCAPRKLEHRLAASLEEAAASVGAAGAGAIAGAFGR